MLMHWWASDAASAAHGCESLWWPVHRAASCGTACALLATSHTIVGFVPLRVKAWCKTLKWNALPCVMLLFPSRFSLSVACTSMFITYYTHTNTHAIWMGVGFISSYRKPSGECLNQHKRAGGSVSHKCTFSFVQTTTNKTRTHFTLNVACTLEILKCGQRRSDRQRHTSWKTTRHALHEREKNAGGPYANVEMNSVRIVIYLKGSDVVRFVCVRLLCWSRQMRCFPKLSMFCVERCNFPPRFEGFGSRVIQYESDICFPVNSPFAGL